MGITKPPFIWQHLNKLRWLCLVSVFSMLVLLPYLYLYQTYVAAHAYDLLAPNEKWIYDAMEALTRPLMGDPAEDLSAVKGNTWSGTFWGFRMSDPLAVAAQAAASLSLNLPFALTALLPFISTALLGRFFCGWICPATLIYELNSNLASWLRFIGFRAGRRYFDKRMKYVVLAVGLLLSAMSGSVLIASAYPPAILGREIFYFVALQGFGVGMIFFLATLLLDVLVARRAFCRYLCPGGALYSLIGRFRILRIRRIAENCNNCAKCNVACEFGLDPLRDNFGQECNNCAACVAICPSDAMTFNLRLSDLAYQGPGHLGRPHLRGQEAGGVER